MGKYGLGVIRHARQNTAMFQALAQDIVSNDTTAAVNSLAGSPLVMSWFEGSSVSDAYAILKATYNAKLAEPDADITHIEVKNGHHPHVNNPLVVASVGLQMFMKRRV